MANKKIIYGLYDDEVVLIDAVKKVRAEGLKIHDCYTPFPVHGLDDAMGLRMTRLHSAGFIFGATVLQLHSHLFYGLQPVITRLTMVVNHIYHYRLGFQLHLS